MNAKPRTAYLDDNAAYQSTEPNAVDVATTRHYRNVAHAWHGGQSSPMYAYASTGTVTDRDELLAEIDSCRRWILNYAEMDGGDHQMIDDMRDLDAFHAHIAAHQPSEPTN